MVVCVGRDALSSDTWQKQGQRVSRHHGEKAALQAYTVMYLQLEDGNMQAMLYLDPVPVCSLRVIGQSASLQ